MRERDIEKYLVERIEALGGEARKVRWVGRQSAPDRLVMLPEETIWVELKAPGKRPTARQLAEHSRMRALGQTVLVIDSFEDIDELFPFPEE